MLSLRGNRPSVSTTRGSLFFRRGARVDPAVAAVVADAVHVLVHPCVVYVVDGVGVHAIHRRVVEKMPVLPAAAFITMTEVSEAIVDAAVETHGQAPVALIEKDIRCRPNPNSPESTGTRVREPSPMCPAPSNTHHPKPNIRASRYNRRRGK